MSTTKLDELKLGYRFTWGKILQIFEIGPYAIASFHPWKTDGATVLDGKTDFEKIHYHVWVYGKDTCHTYDSLDEAMAGCIAYRSEGANHQADRYFIASLRLDNGISKDKADELVLKWWSEYGKGETDGKAYRALVSTVAGN